MKVQTSIVVMHVIFAYAYARNARSPCATNKFYNTDDNKCTDCSECPQNTIISKTCGWFSDTTCESLNGLDFKFLQNSAKPVSKGSRTGLSKNTSIISKENMLKQQKHRWFTIAMVLSGILCFVGLCIAGYIIVACFVCKKKKNKDILYNPVYLQPQSEDEPRYVEVFTSLSRDRLKRPQPVQSRISDGSISTFQNTSALPLLQSEPSENIYINCMEYLPYKSKDTNDYVYLESN